MNNSNNNNDRRSIFLTDNVNIDTIVDLMINTHIFQKLDEI